MENEVHSWRWQDVVKVSPGVRALRCDLLVPPGQGACHLRARRRGEIDADEGHQRHASADEGPDASKGKKKSCPHTIQEIP